MSFRLAEGLPTRMSRLSRVRDVKKKYFFVVEGQKTEVIYINALQKQVQHSSLVELILLERIHPTHSHPLKITEMLEAYMTFVKEHRVGHLQKLISTYQNGELDLKELQQEIQTYLKEDVQDIGIADAQSLAAFMSMGQFEWEYDEICLIFDRDSQSFKDSQFDRVLHICEKNNYQLCMTNPTFEFFLLLHLVHQNEINEKKVMENKKETKHKRYVEYQLNEKLKEHGKSFKKNQYDASYFVERFSDVKKNGESYLKEASKLKDEIGTSLYFVIENILNEKNRSS